MVKEEDLPGIDKPLERQSVDNYLAGVYFTDKKDIWRLDIRDWMNRVVESTIYSKKHKNIEEKNGIKYRPLEVPEDMEVEAYLKEILRNRVEELEEDIEESRVKVG